MVRGEKLKICSPSPVMVASPNVWKILEWDEKLQTNKQTKTIIESNKQTHSKAEADRQLQNMLDSQWRNTSLKIDWNSYEIVFCENVKYQIVRNL